MKRLYYIILGIVLFSNSTIAQNDVVSQQQNNLFHLFFDEALKNRLQGNYQKSIELYVNCLKLDEKSSSVAYELSRILKQGNDLENANKFIDMALANSTEYNKFYNELAIDIKLNLQKYEEALVLLDKNIANNSQDVQSYLLASNICSEFKYYDRALKYLNSIPSFLQVEDYILPSKYDILMKKGDKRKAYKLIKAKYKKNPNNAKYNFYLADYYLRDNDSVRGIVQLRKAIDCEGGDIYNFDMASLMLKINKIKAFTIYSNNAFKSPNVSSSIKFNKLISSLSNIKSLPSDFDSKLFFTSIFDTLLVQYPEEEQFYSLYAEYLSQYNDKDDDLKIIDLYKKLSDVGMSLDSWKAFLFKLSSSDMRSDLLLYSEKALIAFPDDPLILLLKGECYVFDKDYKNALEPLRKSYSSLSNLNGSQFNQLKIAVLNDLATTYFYLDSVSSSFAYYEEILAIDPYNIGALNNYSYYMSLLDVDLDKAEQMSRKTVDIDPLNPTYLDTYAWILYKKKNYNEALFIIERAIDGLKDDHENDEIFDHYGDILFANGNKAKAIEYWQKSYNINPTEELRLKIEGNAIKK